MASSNKRKRTLFEYYTKSSVTAKKSTEKQTRENNEPAAVKKASQLTLKGKTIIDKKYDRCYGMFSLPISPTNQPKCIMKEETVLQEVSPKEDKTQMYLDVGQRAFGHTICKGCGMVYVKTQEEDEAYHAKHHDKIAQKLRFNGWKTEHVVKEFHDGKIICINANDPPKHKKKLMEILEVVDMELSCSSLPDTSDIKSKSYLFISSKKVIGLALAVPIEKAHPIVQSQDTNYLGHAQSYCCSNDVKESICGINRIWVFARNRRQGIASRLIDAIRCDFIYGCVIEKESMAFSDPTPNGRAFAEKYVGKENLLVFR